MATVISLINLKGGVGKTTTCLALADILAYEYKYKVLVIDLDPQTNVTVSLIHQDEWEKRDKNGLTLKQLFLDAQLDTSVFVPEKAIVKNVSNVSGGIKGLDLLPSSLGLIEIQDKMAIIATTSNYTVKPTEILKKSINHLLSEYDFVLVDCPPNLGTVTLNGIFISDYYIIPTIPDILSTYGIPQITNKVSQFARKEDLKITPLGIVITKYRSELILHNTTIETLENKHVSDESFPRIFKTRIPLTGKAEEAADYNDTPNTLKQKYGYKGLDRVFMRLVEEIHEYV
jgi:chromosome partitioning protein